ncbi:SDR family NAD(P)-dependent oxidoreductase [Chloroflexota bacterium]
MRGFSLEGKTSIVTGGSHGIGKATALAFAEAGANTVIASRNLPDLEEVAAEIRGYGRRCLAVRADIGQKDDINNLVETTINEFGTVDVLVNNAYTVVVSPLLELHEDDWDRTINTDLKGYYLCSQAVGKVMTVKRSGSIINLITGNLAKLSPHVGAYMIAKAGIAMLTKVLAVELGEYGIRVNAIAPGIVKTRFSYPMWRTDEARKNWEEQIPLGRLGQPDDMARVALFLASEASSYITGTTIYADGGMQA